MSTSQVRNNAEFTRGERVRGRPFAAGNPGRRPGSRNKATLAAEALLEGEAEALTRKAVEMALSGDTTALRLCLERIAPPRKDRPVTFALPDLTSAKDAVAASAALLQAVAEGDLTPLEAGELSKLVANHIEALKTTELEERLAALEAQVSR
jgi:hypothetical protein